MATPKVQSEGKPVVAKAKGEVERCWEKATEAEERTKLMMNLVKDGIGTNEVENFFGKE